MQCHGPNTFYCALNRNKISFGKWPFSAIRILDLIICTTLVTHSLLKFRQGIYFLILNKENYRPKVWKEGENIEQKIPDLFSKIFPFQQFYVANVVELL